MVNDTKSFVRFTGGESPRRSLSQNAKDKSIANGLKKLEGMTWESIKDNLAFQEMAKLTGIFVPTDSLTKNTKERIIKDVIKSLGAKNMSDIFIDTYAYKIFY